MHIEPTALNLAVNLRPDEAAAFLNMSASTLAKLRMKGSGPAFLKCGRIVLYARSDLEAWLNSRRRRSTSDSLEAA